MRNMVHFGLAFWVPVVWTGCNTQMNPGPNVDAQISELDRQAIALSRQGDDAGALICLERALNLCPDDSYLLEQKSHMLWNVCADRNWNRFISFCEDCLTRRVGNEVFFRFWKAQALHDMGMTWVDGQALILDPAKCQQAVKELARAHDLDPNIVQTAEKLDWVPLGWQEHFGALLNLPEYQAVFGSESTSPD